ncbi:GbsR/MarR family transcriptional regulator [Luteipulveratus mongoliensis]|uniref:MarR family transcriptional regulator n=1 Tax=Luteipulveratus mongoliensis TaxID=571913 RepID=A0A0K1JE07_9MICO|nr:MarR family transcriptional regulator [Luteipulveratus mongoliensis]AKU14939.1 MarR family transcriptional regulator [Luteipulveratus mongoliensis]
MSTTQTTSDRAAARAHFVEAFGDELIRGGLNRMPARVFASIAASDEGRRTAAELGEELQASAAAISGAVRYLEQVDMVRRSRPPGSRRDVFALTNDMWYEALTHRGSVIERWRDIMVDGTDRLGRETPAGERMAMMADFFAFLAEEMPAMLERWREHREQTYGA